MNTPPAERVGYHGVTHACGCWALHEVRGTEAEQDAMHALLRSRPCLACQQTAGYQGPISASMDHPFAETAA